MKKLITCLIIMLFICLPITFAQNTTPWYMINISGTVSYSNNTPFESGEIHFTSSTESRAYAISNGAFSGVLSGPANTVFSISVNGENLGIYTLSQNNINWSFTFVLSVAPPTTNQTMPWYMNMVYGSVEYSEGSPVESGAVVFSKLNETRECAIHRGSFSCILSGYANTTFSILVNGYDMGNYTLAADNINQHFSFRLPISPPVNNFPDEDRDGIPDAEDYCLHSELDYGGVDIYGCTCAQKIERNCEGPFCCPEVNGGRGCTEGPDISPTCATETVKPRECDVVNQCLADQLPKYCDSNNTLVDDCVRCGCPETFNCDSTSGKCVKTIQMKGLKCKVKPYKIAFTLFRAPNHYCRHTYGSEWIAERSIKKMLKIPQVRNIATLLHFIMPLEWTLLMTLPLYITICVSTEDQGCVPQDTLCRGEANLPETLENIEKEIRRRSGLKVSLDRLDFKISTFYSCPPVQITSDSVCKKVVNNGDSSEKIDILFVGDGFIDNNKFDNAVAGITDFEGDNGYFGIFSEEPFKSNKDKFNVWSVNGKDMIRYEPSPIKDGGGMSPKIGDVHLVSKACSVKSDQIIVLSTSAYRSFAQTAQNIALCSVGGYIGSKDSRLVLHEFGHSFGKLGDEYHNYVETVEEGSQTWNYATFGANCQITQDKAVSAWGNLIGTGEGKGTIGYFGGCGDDCGDECYSFIRPTEVSIMRDTAFVDSGRYVGYYTFNKKLIEEEIRKATGSVTPT